jgi:hypothetical protein
MNAGFKNSQINESSRMKSESLVAMIAQQNPSNVCQLESGNRACLNLIAESED